MPPRVSWRWIAAAAAAAVLAVGLVFVVAKAVRQGGSPEDVRQALCPLGQPTPAEKLADIAQNDPQYRVPLSQWTRCHPAHEPGDPATFFLTFPTAGDQAAFLAARAAPSQYSPNVITGERWVYIYYQDPTNTAAAALNLGGSYAHQNPDRLEQPQPARPSSSAEPTAATQPYADVVVDDDVLQVPGKYTFMGQFTIEYGTPARYASDKAYLYRDDLGKSLIFFQIPVTVTNNSQDYLEGAYTYATEVEAGTQCDADYWDDRGIDRVQPGKTAHGTITLVCPASTAGATFTARAHTSAQRGDLTQFILTGRVPS